MQFTTTIMSTLTLLMAGQAMSAAIAQPGEEVEVRQLRIATDPYYACNCPNNCSHKAGSSCKFYAGPSDSSDVTSGTCASRGGSLTCVP